MSELQKSKIIIEDSTFSRAALCTKLNSLGYENIDLPEDSAEGWSLITQALVEDEPYDLVITDLNMPGIDGMDLIERIKNDPVSKDQKILVVSADADEIIIKAVLDMGAEDYLVKPVAPKDLQASIEKILG